MALDDSLFGGDGNSVLRDSLLRAYQPDDGEPFSGDAAVLTERLARKLGPIRPPSPPSPAPLPIPEQLGNPEPPPSADAPDLSSFGEPVAGPKAVAPPASTAPSTPDAAGPDLSSFGDAVPGTGPQKKPWSLASLITTDKPYVAATPSTDMSLLDDLARAKDMSPSERAKLMGRAIRNIPDRGTQMDFNAALQRIARGGDAKAEVDRLTPSFVPDPMTEGQPVAMGDVGQSKQDQHWAITRGFMRGVRKENPDMAAEALEGFSHLAPSEFKGALSSGSTYLKDLAKRSPEEYASRAGSMYDIKGFNDAMTWAGETIGQGVASSLPSFAFGTAGAVGGAAVAGPAGAAAGGVAGASVPSYVMGYGEVYKALKDEDLGDGKRIKPEDAAKYAAIAAVPIAALDAVSLGPIITKLGGMDAVRHELARSMAKRIAKEVAKGAGREGITETMQEMVKDAAVSLAADKPFWTTEHAKGWLESGVGGALTGGAMSAPGGIRGPRSEGAAAGAGASPDQGAAAPGAGDGPQAPPPGGGSSGSTGQGPSSTEEINDFVRRARESAPPRDEAEQAQPEQPQGPDPSKMSDAERLHAFVRARESHGNARMEDILRGSGLSDDQIKTMSEQDRIDAIIRATKPEPKPEAGQQQSEQPKAAEPKKPTQEDIDYSILRAGGYTHENIMDMGPSQREQEVKYFRDDLGLSVDNALRDYPRPSEQPQPQPQAEQTGDGTRTSPIKATTGNDIVRAVPVEPKSDAQAEAENYKHAHVEIDNLGLSGRHGISVETGVGQKRKGWNTPLKAAYGRIKGTKGADGQPLDVFIGPHPDSPHVFMIDQRDMNNDGFDEHKIMAGFRHPKAAMEAYIGSYDDADPRRIKDMTAIDADQFKHWLANGDHTKPFKQKLSDAEIGDIFDDVVGEGEKGAAASEAHHNQEAAASSDGADGKTGEGVVSGPRPSGEAPTQTGTDRSEAPLDGEVIPPSRVRAEPTDRAHAEIEAVLGEDYDRVMPNDIARAAELMAENEGMPADVAFQWAFIQNAVAQKYLTHQQAVEVYGPEVEEVLAASGESASGGSEDHQSGQTATEVVGPQAGVGEGGGETGKSGTEANPAGEVDHKPDAGRTDADTAGGQRNTGGQAVSEAEQSENPAAPEGVNDDRGKPIIGSGTVLRTKSGRHTSPAPKIDLTTDRKATATIKRLDAWLLDEARKEVASDDGQTSLMSGFDPNKFSQSDRDHVNLVLFGDVMGPKPSDVVEPTKTEPKKPAAATTTEPETSEEPGEKITAVGERLEGARRSKWEGVGGLSVPDLDGMSDADKAKNVTKENVWSRPDYAAAVEQGVEPKAAALLKRIYDRIGTKPNMKWNGSTAAKSYVEVLTAARELAGSVKTIDDVRQLNDRIDIKIGGNSYYKLRSIYQQNSRKNPFYVDSVDIRAAERAVENGFPNTEPWTRLFLVQETYIYPTEAAINAYDNDGKKIIAQLLDEGYAVDNATSTSRYKPDALSLRIKNTDTKVDPSTLTGEAKALWGTLLTLSEHAFIRRGWGAWRKSGGLIGEFGTKEEAVTAAKDAYAKLPEDRKKGGEAPNRPHLENVVRDGPDYRKGANVTGQDLIDTFGFRGVDFGNWAANDERQRLVNYAFDALHDLARVMGVAPKAISLNGTLGIAFGSHGRGGKGAGAAHYQPGSAVINMTKMHGAGSLAHEFGHALDDYLGSPVGQMGLTGGRLTPEVATTFFAQENFMGARRALAPKLRQAANRLMHDIYNADETDDEAISRVEGELAAKREGQKAWIDRRNSIRAAMKAGGSRQGLKQAEDQIEIWGRSIDRLEKQLENGIPRKAMPSSYLRQAQKISGPSGEYWHRPEELFARAWESFIFDKIKDEGFQSDYLVHGVEGDRYAGDAFLGNPYPAGEERKRINADFERLLNALHAIEGKHGAGTKLAAAEGLPEPIATGERIVKRPAKPAVDPSAPTTLAQAFENHFGDRKGFESIIQARKFAKDAGFAEDAKSVEEAIELAVVRVARSIVDQAKTPQDAFQQLVDLYGRQPNLGTRTSTSVRDQAYSTPVPLAYVAARLAEIDKDTFVYEPTAGNGALLITAAPENIRANEMNPDRASNLRAQGITTTEADASEKGRVQKGIYDRVIANPPFGAVRQEGQSKVFDMSDIQPGYETHEIDHAISLRALDAMKPDGKAVLILGGIAKTVTTPEGRSNAYNGKAKREFYLTLYRNYNVVDHFTVAGELYTRQGAGWPVDVIVIDGKGKSSRSVPAVNVPRIYDTWADVGGLLGKRRSDENADAPRPSGGSDTGARPGVAGSGGGGGGRVGGQRPSGSGVAEKPGTVGADGVRGKSAGDNSGRPGDRTQEEPGKVNRTPDDGGKPSRLTEDEIGDIFDEAVDELEGNDRPTTDRPKSNTRTTADVARSAAENLVGSADDAMAALAQLFGGGKTIGTGLNFDEETYRKAKPLFMRAAQKFAAFRHDIGELVRRMVAELREVYKLSNDAIRQMRPYAVRFIADVQNGIINLYENATQPKDETARSEQQTGPREKPQQTAKETEGQSTYHPRSKTAPLDTLVPVNMRASIDDALTLLEKERGKKIDQFVADELGYSVDQLGDYFGAEQVDALGLAIDNLKRGSGFIIGDQTGIGKGRVNAAIIRWAIKNGHIPVFVTEKPNLYKDMYRDMAAIGLPAFLGREPRILVTNAELSMDLDDAGSAKIETDNVKNHDKVLAKAADGDFKENYDMVFSTYSQMQTLKGEETGRRAFIDAIAPRSIVIFDESHNAGGEGDSKKSRKKKGAPVGRSGFARQLISKAVGVFYSSATYAKRPDVMDLYSKTDMVLAVNDPSDLAEAIGRGGVPMQQVVAAMLAKAGQYIRRERSFAGIEYNTVSIPVDRDAYDDISYSLDAVQQLSRHVAKVAEQISVDIKGEGGTIGTDNAVGDAGASSTNFTAIMHNLINQMLLAMKVDQAADAAIAAIKAGQKPVLTVANTMESFLSDYAKENGISVGGVVDGDFSTVLHRYLDRARTITIKRPFEEPVRHRLTDEELGKIGVALYNKGKAIIDGIDLSGLPLSPIDHLKGRLEKAGYRVGEITGRNLTVDYTADVPVLRARGSKETSTKGRNSTLKKFNTRPENDGIHALILNQAGSTGLSAHASVDFDDRSPRHMFVVQPEANIDTHMQLLGRINRTGQVVLPRYSQLVADIPAEKRPAAVLSKKMASLNANTTASRTSAVTAKDVPDFINAYGDLIAVQYLRDHPEMMARLADPIKVNEETGKAEVVDAMRKLTGRLPLIPLEEQEAVYQYLENEYNALIEQLDASGENALEAKTVNLKAKTLETTEVVGRKGGGSSPFAAPVNAELVSVARTGKPFTPKEVIGKVISALSDIAGDKNLKRLENIESIEGLADILKDLNTPHSIIGRLVADAEAAERKREIAAFDQFRRDAIADISEDGNASKLMTRLNDARDRWVDIHQLVPIGARVVLKTASGNMTAIVTGVTRTGSPKNPLALSTWKATFAISDATRQMSIPFSRLFPEGKSDEDSETDIEVVVWRETPINILTRFQYGQFDVREERVMLTGNLLAAYDWASHKGAIINYTINDGEVRPGILMARGFNIGKHAVAKGKIVSDLKEIVDYLNQNPANVIKSYDSYVTLQRETRWTSDIIITVPKSKRAGGIYYLDDQLTKTTGDFSSRGNQMIVRMTPGSKLNIALRRMQQLGAMFTIPTTAPKATKVEDQDEPKMGAIFRNDGGEPVIAPQEVKDRIADFVHQLAGKDVGVEFSDDLFPSEGPVVGWGDKSAEKTLRGYYLPISKIVAIALHGKPSRIISTALHEAYHHVAERLMTPAEKKLMAAEHNRIRRAIHKAWGTDMKTLNSLAGFEVEAVGAEVFSENGNLDGVHVGARRWYHRFWQAMRRLANALRGLGYKTAEDVYEQFRTGGFANRETRDWQPSEEMRMGALHGMGPRQPGPQSFDTTLGDILGTRVRNRLTGMNVTELQAKAQDKFIRVKKAEQAKGMIHIGPGANSGLNPIYSAYQAESLYYGRTGHRLEQFETTKVDPLIREMKGRGITQEELDDYLYAKHAEERNVQIGLQHDPGTQFNDAVNDPSIVGASGISTDEANQVIDDIRNAGRLADFQAVERMVRDIIDATNRRLLNYGLITQDQYDNWTTMYNSYVPLRGFQEGSEHEQSYMNVGGGYDTRAKESKEAFGRGSVASGPLSHVLLQAEMSIVRGEKNRVGNTFLRFVQQNPDADRWEINRVVYKPRRDPVTGMISYMPDNFADYNDPKVFITKVGGIRYRIRLKGPDAEALARALNTMGTANLPGLIRMVAMVTRTMARMSTSWNPDFVATNFIRDLGEAYLNMQENDRRELVRNFQKHLIPSVVGATRAVAGRGAGNRYVQAFHEFDAAGGRIRFFGLENAEDIHANVNRKLRRLQGGLMNGTIRGAEALGEAIEIANAGVENGVRLAFYMAARDIGVSIPDAARMALELTVNFTRKGEYGSALSALYMFANAAIQGSTRMVQALKHPKVRRAAYMLTAAGVTTTIAAILMGGDDDDGDPYYMKLPPWQRDKALILMWPKGFGLDGYGLRIPLPYGYAPFAVLGSHLVSVAMGKEKPGMAAGAVTKSIIDAFDPLGNDENIWAKLLPSVIRPQAHIELNKNWTGKPLYPVNSWSENMPDAAKFFRSNSDFSVGLAKKLNEWTGGSVYTSGLIDVHPGSIDHWMQAITGGAGQFIAKTARQPAAIYNGEWDATKAPIIGRFVGRGGGPEADSAAYYDLRNPEKIRADQIRKAQSDQRKNVNTESARDFLEQNRPTQRQSIFSTADKQLSALRKQEAQARSDETLTTAERQQRINEIRERMRAIQNDARKRVRELDGASP